MPPDALRRGARVSRESVARCLKPPVARHPAARERNRIRLYLFHRIKPPAEAPDGSHRGEAILEAPPARVTARRAGGGEGARRFGRLLVDAQRHPGLQTKPCNSRTRAAGP